MPSTPSRDPLPIYLAAIGPRALRLAGEVADGVLLNAYAPVEYIRWAVNEVRNAASNAGRDPASIDITCMLIVRLTDDPDAMLPALRERVARLVAEPFVGEVLLGRSGFDTSILAPVRELIAAGDESGAARYVSDELAEACYLLGDAARCRDRIRQYTDAGVEHPAPAAPPRSLPTDSRVPRSGIILMIPERILYTFPLPRG